MLVDWAWHKLGAIALFVVKPADADSGDNLEKGGCKATVKSKPELAEEHLMDAVEVPHVPLRMVGSVLPLELRPDHIPVTICV